MKCRHLRQNWNGSNQYQSMIQCNTCGKVLALIYPDVVPNILEETPVVKQLLDRKQGHIIKPVTELQGNFKVKQELSELLQDKLKKKQENTSSRSRICKARSMQSR